MVAIFFANGFEEIEAVTVYDVLKRAGVDVVSVGIGSRDIIGAHGLMIKTDTQISEFDESGLELAVLPGGMPGTKNLQGSNELIDLLKQMYKSNKRIAAICAAPSILGALHFLIDKEAVCYPGFEKYLEGAKLSNKTTLTDGMITTSKGAGTAMDFSLELVRVLKGDEMAKQTAKKLQYMTEDRA